MYILNAFSLNMIREFPRVITVREIPISAARKLVEQGGTSAVGHPDTAAVFSAAIGREVPVNRVTVALSAGDTALVGQYRGPRLPEGAKTLPEGATIQWYRVEVS